MRGNGRRRRRRGRRGRRRRRRIRRGRKMRMRRRDWVEDEDAWVWTGTVLRRCKTTRTDQNCKY